MRQRLRHLALFLTLLAAPCVGQPGGAVIQEFRATGSGLSRETVLALSGLKTGETATPADFAEATKKLMETGLFESVEYHYAPSRKGEGFSVSFSLVDSVRIVPVRVDIPGVEEEKFFAWLAAHAYPYPDAVPESDAGQLYYQNLLTRYLEENGRPTELIIEPARVPATNEMLLVFRPKELAGIAQVRFEGCNRVSCEDLNKALSRAPGARYTERSFREMLEHDLLPLFEAHALHAARFTDVRTESTPAGLVVTTTVEEGEPYRLRNLEFADQEATGGSVKTEVSCKPGMEALQREIMTCIEQALTPLKREGYVSASTRISKTLLPDQTVDISVSVRRGPQSTLGAVRFLGLAAAAERRLRERWKMAPGSPFNPEYIDDFLSQVSRDGLLRGVKNINVETIPGQAGNSFDVVVTFRR